MVWREKKEIFHGNNWKFVILILLVVMFIGLIELFIWSLSFDPIVPIIILILIILLIPVTAFIVDTYFHGYL